MPISNVIRIMGQILPPHAKIVDDAKETIHECVYELIHYLYGNEKCHQECRKTVTPENIISTMGTIYFNKSRNQEAECSSLQRFLFVKRTSTFIQPEPPVTQPPPPPQIGYAPSSATYPLDPNYYIGPSQMNNNYIHNLGGQCGSSSDNLEFDTFIQFK
ncbi:hypothetical protein ACJIZ3_005281 [Penstemon smallii]|uniref:Transcription factor CBF/NF-Y/archaeal histone domain-containing protein n=1 Tax=Penstemon smallii TaxID=265156 RepID=A0ABD3S4H8_9LAMI